MLQIYNSKSQQKEIFTPIVPGHISIYTCGITVYDFCHIGHARTFIAFDVIVRYLRMRNYQVHYIRNITDIDDKIINRANENSESTESLTARFIAAMHEDFRQLNLLSPDAEPKASEFIPQMLELVQTLEQKGFAYAAKNGDVYYHVRNFKTYGSLSKRNIDDLQLSARIEANEAKNDPLDFVLWKAAKPGEPAWDSPWGKGRPGWHLECSAMSMHYLGNTLDLHGGGYDLIFPHHENECAQSEAATGCNFVNAWMHVGFLKINQDKMSKSLNNFFTIRDVLQVVHPEVLRYTVSSAHYRSHLEYSKEQINASRNSLEKFYLAIRGVPAANRIENSEFEARFIAAMDDDFNTSEALAVLFDLTKEINRLREISLAKAASSVALLKYLANILGLLHYDAEDFLQNLTANDSIDVSAIEELIAARNTARANKDWGQADNIRKQLDALGIIIEDGGATGTIWRKK